MRKTHVEWETLLWLGIEIVALALAFGLGGHWGLVIGLIWVVSGVLACLLVLLVRYPAGVEELTLDNYLAALVFGLVALCMIVVVRIPSALRARTE